MESRTKWIIGGIGAAIVTITTTILITVYMEDIKEFLGYSSSPKTTTPVNRDRGPVITTSSKPAKGKKAVKKPATAKKAVKEPATDKKAVKAQKPAKKAVKEPATDKPLALREAERKNRCAELPFSYEFEKGDPDAKDHFYKHFWGPNYGCLLAGAHDRTMPGPVPQVRARLEKMSPTRFERYKIRLEKIMRRFACRTFDYYLSTCKEVFDPNHENYLSNEDLQVLLQRPASLHDITPVDRYRVRRAKPKHAKVAKPTTSAELPATTDGATEPRQRRRLRVSLKTRPLPPRLCGTKLKPCPKP